MLFSTVIEPPRPTQSVNASAIRTGRFIEIPPKELRAWTCGGGDRIPAAGGRSATGRPYNFRPPRSSTTIGEGLAFAESSGEPGADDSRTGARPTSALPDPLWRIRTPRFVSVPQDPGGAGTNPAGHAPA